MKKFNWRHMFFSSSIRVRTQCLLERTDKKVVPLEKQVEQAQKDKQTLVKSAFARNIQAAQSAGLPIDWRQLCLFVGGSDQTVDCIIKQWFDIEDSGGVLSQIFSTCDRN